VSFVYCKGENLHHIARFEVRENFFKPYNVQCSCGVGGEFASQDDAKLWMQTNHFDKLSGVNTFEFEKKDLPKVVAAPAPLKDNANVWQPKHSNPPVPGKWPVVAPVPEKPKQLPPPEDDVKNESVSDA
jgi:hypothetical protein